MLKMEQKNEPAGKNDEIIENAEQKSIKQSRWGFWVRQLFLIIMLVLIGIMLVKAFIIKN